MTLPLSMGVNGPKQSSNTVLSENSNFLKNTDEKLLHQLKSNLGKIYKALGIE